MKPRQDDRQKEIENNMKEQIGKAQPKPQPTLQRPEPGIIINNGGSVTINGNIIINNRLPHPYALAIPVNRTSIYIGVTPWQPSAPFFRKIAKKCHHAIRQISRKIQSARLKLRQISRKPQNPPNPPQHHVSRHFQPSPAKSPATPNIALKHRFFLELSLLYHVNLPCFAWVS